MSEVTTGVFAVEPGDEVRVATDRYEWSSPMEVLDIEHVEWTPTEEEPWASRTVELEGGYSTEFFVSCSEGDTEIALHSGDKLRGYLERFEPVPEDVDGSDTEPDDSETEPGAADEGSDGEQGEEDELSAVDVERPGDGGDRQDAGNTDIDVALPDGVSEQDVRDACSKHQDLGAVAEVLGIPSDRARTVTVALGCYQHVSDVTGTRYGGVADVQ
jgi:hypothetical protein